MRRRGCRRFLMLNPACRICRVDVLLGGRCSRPGWRGGLAAATSSALGGACGGGWTAHTSCVGSVGRAVKANAAPTRSTQSHRRRRHARGSAVRDGLQVVSWPAQPGGAGTGISAFRQRRQRSADFERVARWCYRPSVVVAASRGTWTRFRRISDECRPELVVPLVHATARTVGLAHVAVPRSAEMSGDMAHSKTIACQIPLGQDTRRAV